MSAIRLGDQMGGAQAPRRESLVRFRYGRVEVASTLVAALYVALAVYVVGRAGGAPEAMVRTARVATIWDGFDPTLIGFGFDRPPLFTLLTLPLAAFPALRDGGLATAIATALTGAVAVQAAAGVAHRAGLTSVATFLFVAAFALNPLLLFAGAVGLPEALYASLVLVALSHFASWLHRESVASVIGAGVALGIAFLVRYDSLLLSAVMGAAFWWIAAARARSAEADANLAPMMAFSVPIVYMVGLWFLISWFPYGNLGEFIGAAREVTRFGGEDVRILDRMREFRAAPVEGALWVVRWATLIAPASVVAILALAVWALARPSRERAALALVSAAVVLPGGAAMAAGQAQPLATHLVAAVAPAFAILGFRQQQITDGYAPDPLEVPRRRAQALWCAALLLVSIASGAAALMALPETDRPAAGVRAILRGERAEAVPPSVAATAEWIRDHVGPGRMVVDTNRHAEVMIATGDFARFRTDADKANEAVAFDPYQFADFVLTRRRLPGQGEGRIERPHPLMYQDGTTFTQLAFEAGEYRIYRVLGPALP